MSNNRGEQHRSDSGSELRLGLAMILVQQSQSLWLNSGCPTQKSLDKTVSSKSHAKQLKLKKTQC
jgi:hypothetical protein